MASRRKRSPGFAVALLLWTSLLVCACYPPGIRPTGSRLPVVPTPSALAAGEQAQTTGGSRVIRIVSSLPLTGSSSSWTPAIIKGFEMALEEKGRRVGRGPLSFAVEYESWNGAALEGRELERPGATTWERERANAAKAVKDGSILVYLGTFNSDGAKVSIPVLCEAKLVMISPSNTYVGLTKKIPGVTEADEPEKYYPNGCTPNYNRVIPADDVQGLFAARWAEITGARSVYVMSDHESYGKGLASVFIQLASPFGLSVVSGPSPVVVDMRDPERVPYRSLADAIKRSGANLVFYAGRSPTAAGMLWKNVRRLLPGVEFMGGDTLYDQTFLKAAEGTEEGTFVTFAGAPPNLLEGEGVQWYRRFQATPLPAIASAGGQPALGAGLTQQTLSAEGYAAFGYEAMRVALSTLR